MLASWKPVENHMKAILKLKIATFWHNFEFISVDKRFKLAGAYKKTTI